MGESMWRSPVLSVWTPPHQRSPEQQSLLWYKHALCSPGPRIVWSWRETLSQQKLRSHVLAKTEMQLRLQSKSQHLCKKKFECITAPRNTTRIEHCKTTSKRTNSYLARQRARLLQTRHYFLGHTYQLLGCTWIASDCIIHKGWKSRAVWIIQLLAVGAVPLCVGTI